MPSVRTTDCRAHTESTFREVQSVTHRAAQAVVIYPLDVRLVDAALVDEVLNEPADRVVGERRHYRRIQPETAFQPSRNVVLASALPNLKRPRGMNSSFTRIEAKHHLAEADQIPAAVLFRFDD